MKTRKIMLIVSIFALLAVLLAACGGPSPEEKAYTDALNTALNTNYNPKLKAFADAMGQSNPGDQNWQAQMTMAADELDQAADGFRNLPTAPAKFQKADELFKQLADQTNAVTQVARDMLDTFNNGGMDEATAQQFNDDYKAKMADIKSTSDALVAELQNIK